MRMRGAASYRVSDLARTVRACVPVRKLCLLEFLPGCGLCPKAFGGSWGGVAQKCMGAVMLALPGANRADRALSGCAGAPA